MKFDYPLRPFQIEAGKAWRGHVAAGRQRGLVSIPTGCHAPGQLVLMYDGRLKKVEDVVVGDLLAGIDGPREVLRLHRGVDEMRRIVPVKGASWVVNRDHILSLVRTNDGSTKAGLVADVSVRAYEDWCKTDKHVHKLFRVPVDTWGHSFVPIDPYFLGVLLGDGCIIRNVSVTKPDPEIKAVCEQAAMDFGLQMSTRVDNRTGCPSYFLIGGRGLISALEEVGLFGARSETKFIPFAYKTGSREQRLSMLAGLLDTDGWYDRDRKMYEFSSKSSVLAHDVAFVAKSLGFAAYVKETIKSCQTGASGTYYIVGISGDLLSIPCRVERKKPVARSQIKNVLRTGFSVEDAGRGEYFGFSVDGDNRYLLGDFTVTHNCGKSIFFLSLIPESGRTLVLVHRDTLARQTVRAAQRVIDGVKCGIVMANEDDVDARDLVVASVPTLARQSRLDRLIEAQAQYGKFRFVVADEAHHAAAKTWQRILDSFRVPTIGVTATAWRDDDKGLAPIWGLNPIYRMTIDQAIAGECPMVDGTVTQHDGGWLVPYESRQVVCDTLDMSRVRVNPETGDYDLSDLEKEVYRADFAKFVAETTKGVVDEGRLTIVFCASVDQAQRTHGYLVKMGVSAAVADGETDPAEREHILRQFQSGKIRALINCQLYVEGADIPEIDCVVNAAPTQSRGKFIQQVGRGLRLCPPHKEYLLIVDIVGAHEAHGLVTAANMGEEVVKEKKDKKNAKPLLLQQQRDREFGMVVSAAKAAQFGLKPKDQKRKHRTRWVTVEDGAVFALPAGEHGSLLMVREPGDADMWMGFRLPRDAWTFHEARKIMKRPAERAFAAGVVEDRARKLGVFSLSSEAAKWRTQPPTHGQLEQFQKAFPGKTPGTRGEVSEALTTHFLRQSMRGFK